MKDKNRSNTLVLGIDPGIARTGYGLVSGKNSSLNYIGCGLVETKKEDGFSERLNILYEKIRKVIKEYTPDIIALEQIFFNKNVKSAFSVGEARGVIALACNQFNIGIVQYTPLQVKQALVGYGRADKTQVQMMIKTLLNISEAPKPDDVSDALAIAICHINSMKILQAGNQK